jgi:hypothetical protein
MLAVSLGADAAALRAGDEDHAQRIGTERHPLWPVVRAEGAGAEGVGVHAQTLPESNEAYTCAQ